MTPSWPPTSWVTGVLGRLGLPTPDVRWERAGAGADWVSPVALRLARGDRDRAAALATALTEDLAARPEVAASRATDAGHVVLTLTDDTLAAMLRTTPPDLGGTVGCDGLSVRGRSLDDPGYRALLAHARLCRLVREAAVAEAVAGAAATQAGGAAYDLPPHEVLVLGADAWRVAERTSQDGRAHHVVDWTARLGAAVVLWTDTSTRSCPVDPLLVGALRDRLASALRAVGLTPTERL